MNKTTITLFIAFFCLLTFRSMGQETYAKLEKNVNFRASDLVHELNKTNDTLILRSTEKISYVYSINEDNKREIDQFVNSNTHQVPLANLSKGKHVFVVGKSKLKIVFVVRINEEIESITTDPVKDIVTLKHN